MRKVFFVSPGLPNCYGRRIFLHKSVVEDMLKGTRCFLDQLPHKSNHPIAKVLREVCHWGGSDKCWDNQWFGYEVSSDPDQGTDDIGKVRSVLMNLGFVEETRMPKG